ncbi:heavy metal translocating P-type ATPase, partial [Pseudomonas aeruginosa]
MDCPTEEALIRGKLGGVPGVVELDFNLMRRTLTVRHTLASLAPVEQALAAVDMQAVRQDDRSAVQTTRLAIAKMDCPSEEALIRSNLATLAGVIDLDFNLMQRTLTVRHAPAVLPDVLGALQSLGFEAQVLEEANRTPASSAPGQTTTHWWPLGISLVAAVAAEAVYWLQGGNHWSVMVLALVAILTGGLSTYKKGWIALKNRNLNMNALMSIAVTGAMLIGHWPEAAMVMVLFALAEVIEAKSLDRARNAIAGLLDLAPERATVQQPDGSWREVDAKQVAIGSRVRVRPGERIALDGEVVEGRSTVNQAPITGESLPVDKGLGDPVFAGSLNESGSFEYRVTALANNSTLARIIHAVEAAQGSRAPTQRFVDQFARWYTPAVFALAVVVALVPPLFVGAAWLDWIYRALVLLVIACPCALVISTPVSIVSGLAAAARHGILIKGGVYLEEGRKLRWLALDKTGTITHGKPAQTDFVALGNASPQHARSLAASLASRSDHPVSKAIAQAALADGVALREVAEFAALPGRGVRGVIDGVAYHLGNHRMLDELGHCSPAMEQRITALEAEGKTAVMLVEPEGVQALMAVADTIKDS